MKKINKKILLLIFVLIILIISIIITYKNMIKNKRNGNNMSSQEIVDYILNINYYNSNIAVQVNSNKNTNKYIINQEYNKNEENIIQEVQEPSNIAGVKIKKTKGNITVENTNLKLSTIFENYELLEKNSLDLVAFIEDYKKYEKSSFDENDEEIIMKTKNENIYTENKILYINKNTKKPTKLIIQDNNKNTTINIQYNEIEIN